MQFKISIDESTQLGATLFSLPRGSRQARLLELATFGLLATTTDVSALGKLKPIAVPSEVQDNRTERIAVATQIPKENAKSVIQVVDYGDLPD